ncbi:hypothetical protein BJ508DRAFT_326775 [Ascobolus immersus RN42]|uniref:Uncharacterized protein n=1 Tax=Ascobolus immersus RN42 TaxID=1160509 RepID=A0A3N4IGZ4_ASCIM|nr:hypothetical protein BJ508DRAFT_326775 [Ascobolus immersus RN42]
MTVDWDNNRLPSRPRLESGQDNNNSGTVNGHPDYKSPRTVSQVPKKPSTRIGNTAKKDWGANKDDVLQQTFGIILADLPRLYREGIVINCSNGKQRIGHPVQGGWIADYKEYGTLFQVNNDSCVMCEIPKDNMGDNVKGPVRDSELYKVKYDEYLKIKRALETKGLTMKQQKPLRDDRDKIVDWDDSNRDMEA